ncbi:MAG TPA: patatin-like phospholipase family protein [Ramlibacter sp.]|nr:patatin-like phospholipase family protein [Ramlibacter sp.]
MRKVNLALQGGGSHGAFTWGVLDGLLSDSRIALEGLSGTSAGALNAVALASGYAQALSAGRDPREGAREALARVWGEIGRWDHLGSIHRHLSSMLWGGLSPELAPTNFLTKAWMGLWSPYQSNPLDVNPLRTLLEREIDFDAIAKHQEIKVFVSATHVNTGKAVIFGGDQLSVKAVLASACLPMLFHAVEIDGEHYWDGGYAVNPALNPLIDSCDSRDIMLIQINPLRREHRPETTPQILDRLNELTFNASLLTQMRSIDLINNLLLDGSLQGGRCRQVLMHRVDGGSAMEAYPASTKSSIDAKMLHALFELGQRSAATWLERHFDDLGERGTVDIKRDYLDDTRLDNYPRTTSTARQVQRGFRPWLASVFRGRKR